MSRWKVILKNMVCHPLIFAVAVTPINTEQNRQMVDVALRFLGLMSDSVANSELPDDEADRVAAFFLRKKLTRNQRFLLYFLGNRWLRAVRELTPWPVAR